MGIKCWWRFYGGEKKQAWFRAKGKNWLLEMSLTKHLLPSTTTESIFGRHPGRDSGTLLCTAGKPPEHGHKPGTSAVPAPRQHHQQQAGVRHAAGPQDPAGAGDRRVQEAAGWRGWQVRHDEERGTLTGKGGQSFCGQWTVDKFYTNVSLFLFSHHDQYKTR